MEGSPDKDPRCVALVEQPTKTPASSIAARLRTDTRNVVLGEPIERLS
jgi:hypothetical protein